MADRRPACCDVTETDLKQADFKFVQRLAFCLEQTQSQMFGVGNIDMTEGKWLSILIPVYNVAPYLEECVMSVLAQTDDRVQILLLDDASTDGSLTLVQELCARYSGRLQLSRHDNNRGLSAARNSLLDEAIGEYVWFLDSDDHIIAGAVDELWRIVSKCNPDLILCDYRKRRFWRIKSFYGPTNQVSRDVPKLICGVFKSRKMYSWLKISRRSLWHDGLRFPLGKAFEDIATTPWLLLRANSYYYAPRPWIYYRQRPGSIMSSVRRNPAVFDDAKHDDMVGALAGYKQGLSESLAGGNPDIDFTLSNFCAIEFTKAGQRLVRAHRHTKEQQGLATAMVKYRDAWQQCSPFSFATLQREYARRLLFHRVWLLHRCLKIARMPLLMAMKK